MSQYPVVLYVEDDARSRKVMQLLLVHQMGLQHVTMLEDSTNFLARAKALTPKPDVIFLDIHVKPHSGFEMLEMLRQDPHWNSVPIVALTASVMNEEVDQLKTSGFHSCIAKPLNLETFPDTIRSILNGVEIWSIVS